MAGQGDQVKPISLFSSYSHKDEDLRQKLETHLAALQRGGLIAEWHDRKLKPGDAWKSEIDRNLSSADIVLLLVSSDFIASDYCWGEEMTKALARHERGEARVIPVILRHCDWRSTPLSRLQAVPKDARPIKDWPDEDQAFVDVVAAIARAVQSVRRRAEEVGRLPDAAAQTQAPSEVHARGAGRAATDPAATPQPAGVVPPSHALPSTPPPALPTPEGEPDDLKRISGIGPGIEKTLHALGIFHFRQIAELTPGNIARIDQRLRFPGCIAREDWIGQARRLAAGEGVNPSGDTLAPSGSAVLSPPEIGQPGEVFRDVEKPWCPELVAIPSGSFVMGSPDTEKGRSANEGPQHAVRFTQPFALGRYPVSFEEYNHFCGVEGRKKPRDGRWGRGRRPAINVSWEDARAYCEWLSEQTGQGYRLPSEAEWEYACRAGTTTRYWWGNEITHEDANYSGGVLKVLVRLFTGKTTEVGSHPPNPWGLYDMHGNVWERVEDYWHDSYEGAPDDGSAWTTGDYRWRVQRGGSWLSVPENLRSADRSRSIPDFRENVLGFRVARTLSQSESVTP
jgi:formylglycine-generating enzyme required for sulfatase activity